MLPLHTYLTVDHGWRLVGLAGVVCLLAIAVVIAALIGGRSKMKLRQQKILLDNALETMSQGLCMFDADGRIMLCNDRYATMMGLSTSSLKGLSLLDLLIKYRNSVGEDASDAEQIFGSVLADAREGRPSTKVIKTSAGRTLRVNDQPMPKGGGWVSRSNRKRAERFCPRLSAISKADGEL
jgi:PAS domain S-box-containing protein